MALSSPVTLALATLALPLAAALLLALVAPLRRTGRPAGWLSVAAALLALVAAITLLSQQLAEPDRVILELARWLPVEGRSAAQVGLRIDGISSLMLVVVTGVAFLVQLFSLEYMAEEPPAAFGRYFAFHSLFIVAMNLLVLAPNVLQLFMGWELVGLTSYLLIGFYWSKPSAARAAVKAFWVTKFADMGLVVALIVLYRESSGFAWDAALSAGAASLVTAMLFMAVMGKSAQFPLHIWLPDAMEGPTPVSALLHAATMVAAGVYLVVRTYPLFDAAPDTRAFMTYLGAFTALFAASIAVVQTDIKKVLAYSTCSQLGYMVAALGAGSAFAGFFHLTTHACFKALLFLGAGAIIHAVHSNELSDMGGLFSKMRLTAIAFIVGALALAGVPGLAGFFSKDLILEVLYERGAYAPLAALLAAALLTAFYMGRVVFLAFFGKASRAASHAHDGRAPMSLPLVILAGLSVVVGLFGAPLAGLSGATYHFHVGSVGLLGTGLGLAGLGLAYLVYGRRTLSEASFAFLAPLGKLARSGAVDRAYELGFRRVMLSVAAAIGWFDRYVVDGVMNFLGWAALVGSRGARRMQSGNVSDYVYAVVAGAVLLLAWGMFG
ncbi:MAG: NADH-quinone oxidoreductase subunit L [Polyangiaceae bacterium]